MWYGGAPAIAVAAEWQQPLPHKTFAALQVPTVSVFMHGSPGMTPTDTTGSLNKGVCVCARARACWEGEAWAWGVHVPLFDWYNVVVYMNVRPGASSGTTGTTPVSGSTTGGTTTPSHLTSSTTSSSALASSATGSAAAAAVAGGVRGEVRRKQCRGCGVLQGLIGPCSWREHRGAAASLDTC